MLSQLIITVDFPDISVLFQSCAPFVHQNTMAAIVQTESKFKPFAIGLNNQDVKLARQPTTKDEAIVTAKWLIKNGYNIDMGLSQINSTNLRRLGVTVEELFDPCKNVAAGAKILFYNYADALKKIGEPQSALKAAISAYNTGNQTDGFKNGYVAKVSAASTFVPALLTAAAPVQDQTPPIALLPKAATVAISAPQPSLVVPGSLAVPSLIAPAAAPTPATKNQRSRSGEFVYSAKTETPTENDTEISGAMVFK